MKEQYVDYSFSRTSQMYITQQGGEIGLLSSSVMRAVTSRMRELETGGGQNLERPTVERPIFQNFKVANIKIKKDEFFDNFIFELFFHFLEIF